jgi:hypothetical protein
MAKYISTLAVVGLVFWSTAGFGKDIIHDAEHDLLKAQHADAWTKDEWRQAPQHHLYFAR